MFCRIGADWIIEGIIIVKWIVKTMVEVQDVTEHEEGPTLRQRGPGNAAAVVAESGDGEENAEVVPQEQEVS